MAEQHDRVAALASTSRSKRYKHHKQVASTTAAAPSAELAKAANLAVGIADAKSIDQACQCSFWSPGGKCGGVQGGFLTTFHLSDRLRLCAISRSISRSMRASSHSISISRSGVMGIAGSLVMEGRATALARAIGSRNCPEGQRQGGILMRQLL
jgi:hypothetical protein